MRTLTTLAVSAMILLLSCKKEKAEIPLNRLVGKWRHTKTEYMEVQHDTVKASEKTYFNDPLIYVQFNADMNGVTSDKSGSVYVTTPFTYTFTDFTVSLNVGGTIEKDDIISLTDKELTIRNQFNTSLNNVTTLHISDSYFTK